MPTFIFYHKLLYYKELTKNIKISSSIGKYDYCVIITQSWLRIALSHMRLCHNILFIYFFLCVNLSIIFVTSIDKYFDIVARMVKPPSIIIRYIQNSTSDIILQPPIKHSFVSLFIKILFFCYEEKTSIFFGNIMILNLRVRTYSPTVFTVAISKIIAIFTNLIPQ